MNREKPEINNGPHRRAASRPPAGRPRISRRLWTPLAAIGLLAVAWFAWERFPADLTGPGTGPAPDAAVDSASPTVASAGDIYYGPPGSLAVLPFADASAAGGQQAQAFGFAAELLGRLQQVPGLQVTAQSSSFFFRDPAAPLRVVSQRLQSRLLLTGSWRSTGQQFNVTAALFDARRNEEVWRGEGDGALADVLRVQDELARAVLDALPIAVQTDWAPPAAVIPENWALLQSGRFLADPLGPADLSAAAASIHLALEHQPDYDAARLALAELWLHPAWPQPAERPAFEDARGAAEQVLAREPAAAAADRAHAWGLLTYVRHHHAWEWQAAADAADRALALAPGDASLLALASLAHFTLGALEQARELLQEAVRRDPLNLGTRLRLGLAQEFSGLYDEALATYRQVLSLRPDYPGAHAYRARVKVLQGKPESALRESAQEADPFWQRYAEVLALVAADRRAEAEPLLERMMAEDGSVAAFQVAEILAYEGEVDAAFEWLQRARMQRDPGLSALLGNPLLEALRSDLRWAELQHLLGLPADPGGAVHGR